MKHRALNQRFARRTVTLAAIAAVIVAGGCSSPDTDTPAAPDTTVTPTHSPQDAATGTDLTPEPSPTHADAPEEQPPAPAAPPAQAAPAPPAVTNFDGHAGPQSQAQGDGTFLSVTGVRTGQHDGYTRIVIDMDGQGNQPGYDARYVDAAYEAGSGNLLPVAGATILQVNISGWGYPFDTGVDPYAGPRTMGGPASGSVAQVQLGSFYEGVAQIFVGVRDNDKPYRVSTLQNPTRVVIDVAD
ncbi:AMIN-like domain-containing (lipo)protein [Hoyosella subflava]|uniref:AMIN-like domain-containing (lipo)protein n=1 Tax=Hoyosella subflava TaxID=639313 RepID=UPI00067409F2|nr:AMIN domain-containing protein [Hoyosella subflava]